MEENNLYSPQDQTKVRTSSEESPEQENDKGLKMNRQKSQHAQQFSFVAPFQKQNNNLSSAKSFECRPKALRILQESSQSVTNLQLSHRQLLDDEQRKKEFNFQKEKAILVQKIEMLEAENRELQRCQKGLLHDQIEMAIGQSSDCNLGKIQSELQDTRNKLDNVTEQLQFEKLRARRLEEDLQIMTTQHIKQVSKMQIDKDSISEELNEVKTKQIEYQKLKNEMKVLQESIAQSRFQEDKLKQNLQDIQEKHMQELQNMRLEVLEQCDRQYREQKKSDVSKEDMMQFLVEENENFKQMVESLKQRVREGWQKIKQAHDTEHELSIQLQQQDVLKRRLNDLQSQKDKQEQEISELSLKIIEMERIFKQQLIDKDCLISQLKSDLNRQLNGLGSPVANFTNATGTTSCVMWGSGNPDKNDRAYADKNEKSLQMPRQINFPRQNSGITPLSKKNDSNEGIPQTTSNQSQVNLLKLCQKMVDQAVRMECKDCGIITRTDRFPDHFINAETGETECIIRQRRQRALGSLQFPIPRDNSASRFSKAQNFHNRTISSIRHGISRNQAVRGSANQLFYPSTAYGAYANNTMSNHHPQNMTQSSLGISNLMNASAQQIYNTHQNIVLIKSDPAQPYENEYTLLCEDSSVLLPTQQQDKHANVIKQIIKPPLDHLISLTRENMVSESSQSPRTGSSVESLTVGVRNKKSHSSDDKQSSLWVGTFKAPNQEKDRPRFDLTEKFKILNAQQNFKGQNYHTNDIHSRKPENFKESSRYQKICTSTKADQNRYGQAKWEITSDGNQSCDLIRKPNQSHSDPDLSDQQQDNLHDLGLLLDQFDKSGLNLIDQQKNIIQKEYENYIDKNSSFEEEVADELEDQSMNNLTDEDYEPSDFKDTQVIKPHLLASQASKNYDNNLIRTRGNFVYQNIGIDESLLQSFTSGFQSIIKPKVHQEMSDEKVHLPSAPISFKIKRNKIKF